MRGEDSTTTMWLLSPCGSPPHAWGRLATTIGKLAVKRFTPTCVGKTSAECGQLGVLRFTPTCVGKTAVVNGGNGDEAVHPHMRGEDV